jgi:HAE1 family hydrophobic/amphiphilic exporter-1
VIRPALLLLLLSAPAAAGPRPLTLREAVALAVRQNPALQAAGAEVGIADAGIVAARGLDDFVLEASGGWREDRREAVPGTPVQQRAFDQLSGAVSLVRPLPTGGRLALSALGGFSRTRFETDIGSMMPGQSIADAYAPSLQLSLEHPLLRGFGVDVARADRKRSRAHRDLAGAQREGLAAALVRDVVTGYWSLTYAARALDIRHAAAASAREQLARVQANIAVGKQPKSASAEIEVAIAQRDEDVLLAEQAVTDRAVELARLCGLPVTTALTATETPAPPERSSEGTMAAALARNPQLQAVRAEGRAAQVEIDVTENGMLPQLDLLLAGGPVASARDAPAAGRQLTGRDNYTVTAGLSFSLPLGRHAARGARDAAREGLRKARLTEADLAAQIAAGVAHGQAAVEAARRRALVLAPSIEAATLDLESERARFEVGRSTNFDVLRRQDALASVQLLLLRARVDHLVAWAALDALTGEILDEHGVTLE